MKVSDKQPLESMDGPSKAQGAKRKGQAGKAATAEKPAAGDELSSAKVKLSSRVQDMKKIKDAVNATPDVDEAKIAKIKTLLAKGEYKVDSKAVADKMVNEHAFNDIFTPQEE